MPEYLYKNKKTDEFVAVFQGMNEPHVYKGENGAEEDWIRVFTVPTASIDTKIDPFSKKSFMSKTANKKETMGTLWDRSRELSEKRASLNGGVDENKEKYYKNYSAIRRGELHPDKKKEELTKKLSTKGISIEL